MAFIVLNYAMMDFGKELLLMTFFHAILQNMAQVLASLHPWEKKFGS